MSMSTTYLFWDIDGTLLSTARAGVLALEDASREVLGHDVDLSAMRTAGMTDAEICVTIAEHEGAPPEAAAEILRAYARLVPGVLGRRQGEVMPNVPEILEALAGRDDVVNMLLTGNVAEGAEAKLRHYGLWQHFGAGGAYSVEGSDRPSIARRARELAAEHGGGDWPEGERMVVIGDTPHDVSCGKAIGARTLAVATGPSYSLAELEACDPWKAVEELPPPGAFEALIGL
jgi:phosphoglycolate phosphatase-like HAD superfamily hydrolase